MTSAGGSSESEWHDFTAPSDSAPEIEDESASNITATDAKLSANIDTENLYTAYEFQIYTNSTYDFTQPDCPFDLPQYEKCEIIAVGQPLPSGLIEPSPGSIPAGSGTQSVSVDLHAIGATLQPDTTYHFRVLAANTGNGQTVVGADQTFTTSEEAIVPEGAVLSQGGDPSVTGLVAQLPGAQPGGPVVGVRFPHIVKARRLSHLHRVDHPVGRKQHRLYRKSKAATRKRR